MIDMGFQSHIHLVINLSMVTLTMATLQKEKRIMWLLDIKVNNR